MLKAFLLASQNPKHLDILGAAIIISDKVSLTKCRHWYKKTEEIAYDYLAAQRRNEKCGFVWSALRKIQCHFRSNLGIILFWLVLNASAGNRGFFLLSYNSVTGLAFIRNTVNKSWQICISKGFFLFAIRQK